MREREREGGSDDLVVRVLGGSAASESMHTRLKMGPVQGRFDGERRRGGGGLGFCFRKLACSPNF